MPRGDNPFKATNEEDEKSGAKNEQNPDMNLRDYARIHEQQQNEAENNSFLLQKRRDERNKGKAKKSDASCKAESNERNTLSFRLNSDY